jgi:hypothetical protein
MFLQKLFLTYITQYLVVHYEDSSASTESPLEEVEELNVPKWLEDW